MTAQLTHDESMLLLTVCQEVIVDHVNEIESLRQQLAERKDQVNQLNSIMRDKGFGQGEIDLMGWYEQQITLHECVHRQITANENLLRQQLTACQAECEEEARLSGAGGSREAALMARLAESQARERVLRGRLQEAVDGMGGAYAIWAPTAKAALALPSDPAALDLALREEFIRGYDEGFVVGAEKGRNFEEEIKEAKREENEECAGICDRFGGRGMHPDECAEAIRSRMAEEPTPDPVYTDEMKAQDFFSATPSIHRVHINGKAYTRKF